VYEAESKEKYSLGLASTYRTNCFFGCNWNNPLYIWPIGSISRKFGIMNMYSKPIILTILYVFYIVWIVLYVLLDPISRTFELIGIRNVTYFSGNFFLYVIVNILPILLLSYFIGYIHSKGRSLTEARKYLLVFGLLIALSLVGVILLWIGLLVRVVLFM
jgi:hypothetical protein